MLLEHLPVELKEYLSNEKIFCSEKLLLTKKGIFNALTQTDWNKSKTARLLGIGRRTIYRKIEEYQISNKIK